MHADGGSTKAVDQRINPLFDMRQRVQLRPYLGWRQTQGRPRRDINTRWIKKPRKTICRTRHGVEIRQLLIVEQPPEQRRQTQIASPYRRIIEKTGAAKLNPFGKNRMHFKQFVKSCRTFVIHRPSHTNVQFRVKFRQRSGRKQSPKPVTKPTQGYKREVFHKPKEEISSPQRYVY